MQKLSYKTLQELNYEGFLLKDAPERVLQFGEGNFLRAFADYFFDLANEYEGFNGKVVLVSPTGGGRVKEINEQDGLYTLYLRGTENGQTVNKKRVISCVSRCLNPYTEYQTFLDCAHNPELRYLVSNTTEAGIVYDETARFEQTPPATFPAKVARFLYERYKAFEGKHGTGFVILSCELIDNNGQELRRCVMKHIADWGLEDSFRVWVEEENLFCSSLVDRIVPGYPRGEAEKLNEENGYIDSLLDTGEVFGFWVIEGPDWLREELPFCRGNMPVIVTPDHTPYKKRKVRILNGAHTTMVLGAFLAGQDIVRDCMKDEVIRGYMNKAIHEEIIPTLTLPLAELKDFANAVQERFDNAYIDHMLLSISLNSTSKWRARCMPSFKGYLEKFGTVPACLAMGLAAYIAFYNGNRLEGNTLYARRPKGDEYPIHDDAWVLQFYYDHRNDSAADLVHAVLTNEKMWGEDMTALPGVEASVLKAFELIRSEGAHEAMRSCL